MPLRPLPLLVTIAVTGLLAGCAPLGGGQGDSIVSTPAPRFGAIVEPPLRAVAPSMPGNPGLVSDEWVSQTAEATGIPERALRAYAGAALAKADEMPSCGLGWNTIAAIGFAESDHGRHGGSSVADDGTVTPPIFGVPLDGEGNIPVPDSDGGALDGDAEHDRAMGPMQLIPQTWNNWHIDGNADGIDDPQNLDDAALATANYLCRASGDLMSEDGWRSGIRSFNPNEEYVAKVARVASLYAERVG